MDILFNTEFDFFGTVFDMTETGVIGVAAFLIVMGAALFTGFVLSLIFSIKGTFSNSFKVTIAILPAAVALVVMLVNGSIGAGIAVAGAFSLVRFRSVPGTAREICAIFIAMASGLAFGMGYIAYAAIFTLILGGVFVLLSNFRLIEFKQKAYSRTLRITIPEDLDYPTLFDDVFEEFASKFKLTRVKTVNMGSLIRLTYDVTLKDEKREKEFLDKLRCRNGNLEISIYRPEPENPNEL